MIDRLLANIAPHSCCGCGQIGSELCEGCKYNIISERSAQCVGCLRPTSTANLCSRCRGFKADAVWCVGVRQGELLRLIDKYKFEAMRSASRPLAELLDAILPPLPPNVVVSVVPAAPAHSRERGFDHMGRIGREFAALRDLSYLPLLQRKTNDTQHFKTKRERMMAAEASFSIRDTPVPKTVLLLDDILTTGATLRVTLGLLRNAGVKTLYGAVVARQPLDERADLW